MVALELDDLSEVLVLDECPIARKLLPEELEELLWVKLVGHALDGGECLAPVALLDPDVHVFRRLCALLELLLVGDLVRIGERVCRSDETVISLCAAEQVEPVAREEGAAGTALTKGSQVLDLAGRRRGLCLLLLLLGLGGRALLLLFLGYLVGREGCAGACVVMTTE